MVVEGLAFGNLLVGALNLVPGLPLDGGRVLKSAVWQLTGSMHRGTVVAGLGRPGRRGRSCCSGRSAQQALLRRSSPTLFDFLLAFVIGFFLWNGATASLQAAKVRRRLPHLVARNLARRTLAVPEDLPLAEAIRRAREAARRRRSSP